MNQNNPGFLSILCTDQAFATQEEARKCFRLGYHETKEVDEFVGWFKALLIGDGPRYLRARQTAGLPTDDDSDEFALGQLQFAWEVVTEKPWLP